MCRAKLGKLANGYDDIDAKIFDNVNAADRYEVRGIPLF